MYNNTTAIVPIITIDEGRRGWVDQPNQRGTFDIIWTCLSTLFICLWTMLHLNLPAPDDGHWTIFWRKARWLLLGVLAPELPMLFAFAQWASAKRSVVNMHKLGFTETEWSLVHAFYADSGGYVVHSPDTVAFPITSMQLQYLVQNGHLNLPTISRKEIWDKSKADKFAKSLAILQTTWLATEVIARAIQDLPITPLELFSLALSITSLSTQWFWLNKPLDVTSPTILTLRTSVADILVQAGDAAKKPFRTTPLDFIEPDVYQSCSWSETVLRWILRRGLQARPILRLPNDRDWQPTTFAQNMSLAIPVVIFATIHLAGWNYSFSSRPELLVWRINVIVIWAVLAVYGASEVILFWKSGYTKMSLELANGYKKTWPTSLLYHVPAFIYFCGRLLLIVEVLVSLRSLPERAFVRTQWTDFIPHL